MVEPPTEAESVLLPKFREMMKDDLSDDRLNDDIYLLRWLRARELDLDKAATMLRTSLNWRKEKKIDDILNEPINREYLDLIFCYFPLFDKYGRPGPIGDYDFRPLLDAGKKPEMIRFLIQTLEIFDKTLRLLYNYGFPSPTSIPFTKFTVIVDLKYVTFAKIVHKKSVEALIEAVKIYEANYPESLGKCIVVNSPKIFPMLFNVIKPFMSEATLSKIAIFDSNETVWRKEVQELVDPSILPFEYGGTKTNYSVFD